MNFATSAPAILSRALRSFWRAKILAPIFAAILCITFTGCVPAERPADLTILNGGEPESLDPAVIVAQLDMRIIQGLFEGLTRLDAKTAKAIPGLAQSWEISDDKKIYTFHLRTNLVWSTGDPITSADVVYSWIRAASPATASDYAGQLYYVKNAEEFNTGKIKDPSLVGIHALDKYTLRVELKNPIPFFLDICAMPLTYVVPQQTIEKFGDHWLMQRPLPVSGPYELVYWRLNDKVRLKKNPLYWDATNTQSEIIDLLPVGSANVAINLYERGQADIVWDAQLIPSELLDVLLQRPDFHTFNYLGTYFIRFNVTHKPFDDPRVRKALALVVDKERIVKKITKGGEMIATHLVPDGTANYTAPDGLAYNPDSARKLLAEAGYPGGKGFPRVEYLFNAPASGSKIHEKVAVELQQMWHDELGIDVDLRQVEAKTFWGMQSRLEFQISRSSWIGDYNDANTFLGMFVTGDGNNRTGWSNQQYDELVRRANDEPDVKEREKLFQQAEAILVRDGVPIAPLYFYVGINYYDTNKVQGIYDNILDVHPLQTIRKISEKRKVESGKAETSQSRLTSAATNN